MRHLLVPGDFAMLLHPSRFLPEVPPEQGWDVQDTLDALVRKAGYSGAPGQGTDSTLPTAEGGVL